MVVVIKPNNKYKAILFLDSECIDYEIVDNGYTVEITILDGDVIDIMDRLKELDVG